MKPRIRRVTVRYPDPAHVLVEHAAHEQGVSIAQYVREASFLRLAWERGLRESETTTAVVRDELRKLGHLIELAARED